MEGEASISSPRRPGGVTAAAVLEFVGVLIGAFLGLGALINLGIDAALSPLGEGSGPPDALYWIIGFVFPLIGLAGILAGIWLLKMKERGRQLGLILGLAALLLGVVWLVATAVPAAIITFAYYGTIVFLLVRAKGSFA